MPKPRRTWSKSCTSARRSTGRWAASSVPPWPLPPPLARAARPCTPARWFLSRGLGPRRPGIERVRTHFSWRKCLLTFCGDIFAIGTAVIVRLVDLYRERAARVAGAGPYKSIISRLAEAHWLPVFSATYDDYQFYLMQLWLPSACSLLVYTLYHDGMVNISTAEVVSPFVVYALLIAYVSMISGFEPSRLVLRRLNPELSDDAQRNELQAVFAFRAHTPEGHCVDQIGKVRRAPGPSLPATLPPPECCWGCPLRRTPPRARPGLGSPGTARSGGPADAAPAASPDCGHAVPEPVRAAQLADDHELGHAARADPGDPPHDELAPRALPVEPHAVVDAGLLLGVRGDRLGACVCVSSSDCGLRVRCHARTALPWKRSLCSRGWSARDTGCGASRAGTSRTGCSTSRLSDPQPPPQPRKRGVRA